MKNYNYNFFSFEEKCKSFISLRELSKTIPYEFNFWVFLLIFLEFSQPRYVIFPEDCVILFFCFLGILTIFINFFIKIIKKLSFKGRLLIFLSLYLFLLFFFFQILIIILPFFLYRLSLSIFLATLSTSLIFLIWILQEENEVSFSGFFKSWLPLIIFFFLLLSLGFWADFLNLRYPFLFFLIYNFSFIKNFFYEDWKPVILKSSLLWNLYRFFLPGAFFNEITMIFSETVIPGASFPLWNVMIFGSVVNIPASNKVLPITTLVKYSLNQDYHSFQNLSYEHKLPQRIGLKTKWEGSQEFVHLVHFARKLLASDDLVHCRVKSISKSENALLFMQDLVFNNFMNYLNKFNDPVIIKKGTSWFIFNTNTDASKMERVVEEQYIFLLNKYSKDTTLFTPTRNAFFGDCFQLKLGDLFSYNFKKHEVVSQAEFKTAYSDNKVNFLLKESDKIYKGLDLQVLDSTNKFMFDKAAATDFFKVHNMAIDFDDEGLTKVLEDGHSYSSNKSILIKENIGEKLILNRLNNINKYE